MQDYSTNFQPNWFGILNTQRDYPWLNNFYAKQTVPSVSEVPKTPSPNVDNKGVSDNVGKSWGQMSFGEQANTIFGGLQTLAGLYSSIQQIGLAKRQLAHQREVWNKTWDAQRKTHNEALGVRAQMRNNGNAQATRREYSQYSI